MRTTLAVVVLLGVVSTARADEKQFEKLFEESLDSTKKLVEILKPIKDKPTASAALPKLKELDQQLRQRIEALDKAFDEKIPDAFLEKMKQKYLKPMKKVEAELEKELARVEGLPEAYAIVKDAIVFESINKKREDLASAMAKTLTTAAVAFKLRYGSWPEKLDELINPPDGRPFIEKESLIDPWERPFQYDPKGKKNEGLAPDIWSLGPRHKDGAIIGNWMKKPGQTEGLNLAVAALRALDAAAGLRPLAHAFQIAARNQFRHDADRNFRHGARADLDAERGVYFGQQLGTDATRLQILVNQFDLSLAADHAHVARRSRGQVVERFFIVVVAPSDNETINRWRYAALRDQLL